MTTRSLTATAPGKLVISGDYAVLDGAPAIVAAAIPRARVRLTAAETFSVVTTGFEDGRYDVVPGDDGFDWGSASPLPLIDAVWRLLKPDTQPFRMEIDTSAFRARGRKLGLGSSAALTVALTGAIDAWQAGQVDVRATAAAAHKDFQGGRGSGLDIATSHAGGLIVFTLAEQAVESIGWPDGLEAAVLWSGVPASTAVRLEKLYQSEPHPSREALANAAFVAAYAWQENDRDKVLAATARFGVSLRSFSDAYGLDIFGAGHAELATLAEHEALVYKPCGAGGGDAGIVLGSDPARVAAFVDMATERGFTEIPALDKDGRNDGLHIEWTPG